MEGCALIKLHKGDCLDIIEGITNNTFDLTVTSPPYDNLRTYKDSLEWGEHVWKPLLQELYRTTKKGGVVVWIVGDATNKGSETGTSFKQSLFAIECGFNLHDTMIYAKDSFAFPMNTRCHQVFEYMFVLSKGSPKTFNTIKDRPNKSAGTKMTGSDRKKDGTTSRIPFENRTNTVIQDFGGRMNIWTYQIGHGKVGDKVDHPAVFPEALALDHILSWSNEGDTVFDPFMGSGTTGKMAILNNRDFIGIEKVEEYFNISEKRINEAIAAKILKAA